MYYAAPYLIAIGRVLMAVIFIQAGISKMFGYAGAQGYMEAAGVPGALLPLVILLEAGGGLAVLLGFFTRWSGAACWPASVCSRRFCSTFIQTTRCR